MAQEASGSAGGADVVGGAGGGEDEIDPAELAAKMERVQNWLSEQRAGEAAAMQPTAGDGTGGLERCLSLHPVPFQTASGRRTPDFQIAHSRGTQILSSTWSFRPGRLPMQEWLLCTPAADLGARCWTSREAP